MKGRELASASDDTTLRFWDVEAGNELRRLRGHESTVNDVAFSPDGNLIASGSWDGTIRFWDGASCQEPKSLPASTYATSVEFSPEGKWLVFAGAQGTQAVDASTGLPCGDAAHVLKSEAGTSSLCFDKTRGLLASGLSNGTVDLCDTTDGHSVGTLAVPGVLALAFSPDGKVLATSAYPHEVVLWNVSDRQRLTALVGHTEMVIDLDFSPDGRLLAAAEAESNGDAASQGRRIILWDLATRSPKHLLSGHAGAVR